MKLGHNKFSCTGRLTCRNCNGVGHIARSCRKPSINLVYRKKNSVVLPTSRVMGKEISSWFKGKQKQADGSSSTGPPVFSCFRDFSRALLGNFPDEADPSPSLTCTVQTFPSATPAAVSPPLPRSSVMSFVRYDPERFLPNGFQRVPVQGRQPAVRAISVQPRPLNEDVAILSIHPMPPHEVVSS